MSKRGLPERKVEAPWTDAEMWDGNRTWCDAFQPAPCRSCSATLDLPCCVRDENVMPPGTDDANAPLDWCTDMFC